MRILGIYLENVQTYTTPTLIPLSETKTIVSGGNDKGKSVLKKALGVFADVYSHDDYYGLINYNAEQATIGLFLSNRTVLMAYLIGSSVQYALYNWQLDICLKQWSMYSPEIARYLGWITIPEEELCINLAESNVNVLVNTSGSTNTEIINSISTIPEIELRLANLKNALEESKEVNKWVQTEIQVQRRHCNFDELRYNNIRICNNNMKAVYGEYDKTVQLASVLYQNCDLCEAKTELKYNIQRMNYLLATDLCDLIHMRLVQIRLRALQDKIRQTQLISEAIEVINDLTHQNKIHKIILAQIEIRNKLMKIVGLEDIIKTDLDIQSKKVNIHLNMLQQLGECNSLGKSLRLAKEAKSAIQRLFFNVKLLCTLEDYAAVRKAYIHNQIEMNKFDVCPLCHQPLKAVGDNPETETIKEHSHASEQ